MKKSRLLAALLVMTMLSTCIISGTFAKYTTTDSGSDKARVAKWGVTALVSGNLFGEKYENDVIKESSTKAEVAVSATSPTGTNVVAPGTKNDTGVTISVSGTPEVSNKVTLGSTAENNKDIYLKAATYATMVQAVGVTADNFADGTYYTLSSSTYTPADTFESGKTYYEAHDEVTVSGSGYYPVVWTVTGNGAGTYTNIAAMVSALQTAFNSGSTDNKPNVDIKKSATITWAWAFNGNNGADTILGNIIAADAKAVPVKLDGTAYKTLTADTDYCTDVDFNYSITVEQTDKLAVPAS